MVLLFSFAVVAITLAQAIHLGDEIEKEQR